MHDRTGCVLALAAALIFVPGATARPMDEAEIASLVADLQDDDVRRNAYRAIARLHGDDPRVLTALEHALTSPDWQQRQLAAHVLRRRTDALATRLLLEVTVEGLRVDDLPRERLPQNRLQRNTNVRNAHDGVRYLLGHAERAEPLLVRGLRSDDDQQRFLCAFILGASGCRRAAPRAAPILIPHLRSNGIPNDALLAAAALYGFGEPALPFLAEAIILSDHQQEKLLRLIMLEITDPPRTDAEIAARLERTERTPLTFRGRITEFDYTKRRKRWWFEDGER